MCGCQGKPVNLRPNAGPPKINPLAGSNKKKIIARRKSRSDFLKAKKKNQKKLKIKML